MAAQTGLYPGIGLKLALASSDPQEPVWASMGTAEYTIPDTDSTVGIAVNGGLTTAFNVLFDAVPTGTAFNIMYDISNTFDNEYILDSVISVASQKLYTWTTDGIMQLDGFMRLTNDGGEDITAAYVQQRAAFG